MYLTCLIFGEGGNDKKFLMALIDLPKFKYHTKKWFFTPDNASGSSPEIILEQCSKAALRANYDLILCFIDLDTLKNDYPKSWENEKRALEQRYLGIIIIWQIDKAEDEYKRAIGIECYGKHKINKLAILKIDKFVNSDFWKRILKPIKDKEMELKQ